MINNPQIYEINTRVWINRFATKKAPVKITQVPKVYWQTIKDLGFDYVWLMGMWQTVPDSVEKYCFVDNLLKEYTAALPDWKKENVVGSPYAIDKYIINPIFGSTEDLITLKETLHNYGLKLLLDFIPNHFHAETSLLQTNPEIFLEANEELNSIDGTTFYKAENSEKYYAHGRDPYFPAWQDTIQVNYFSQKSRDFMTEQLLAISELCDGVRCDMAMLSLNEIFNKTWNYVISSYKIPSNEFWSVAIKKVKEKNPDFLFVAEAYWNLEYYLQKLGFDFTYDKTLYDKLLKGDVNSLREYFKADIDYQSKLVRFLENHDEPRSAEKFSLTKLKAAAVIAYTVPGMRLFFDGQFEGKTIKLPVQLGREPVEEANPNFQIFYDRLLGIIEDDIFKFGEWKLLTPLTRGGTDKTYNNILTWSWTYKDNFRLIAINYSQFISTCHIKLDLTKIGASVNFYDEINNVYYGRNTENLKSIGLYIELKPFRGHILKII
ncbi:MAG: glycosidase [Ignavibacteriae bacterium HGW-Ignavibacteriae-2]|jgi:glycosidase|nr:MAG: glycosidase [Ignavibacteriae bacterium HGW-Ignavibacteriae-2]